MNKIQQKISAAKHIANLISSQDIKRVFACMIDRHLQIRVRLLLTWIDTYFVHTSLAGGSEQCLY